MKTIVVKTNNWSMEHQLDPSIFDGDIYAMYREAVLSVVEKKAMEVHCKIGVLFECYEKKNSKKYDTHVLFNSYYILLGARMYGKAMELRKKVKEDYQIDIREEIEHE